MENSKEQKLLQNYGVLFENIKKDTLLANELAEYGYDAESIAIGETLYTNLLTAYSSNIKETAEETTSYAVFNKLYAGLVATYKTDRKKAKIIYKDQADVLKNLKVDGALPFRNASIMDVMNTFYTTLQNNEPLVTPLTRLKVTNDHIAQQLAHLTQTQQAYAAYVQENGESQQATIDKNKAFDAVTKWITEFYAIAKIALEDKPQLLESVAKLVRN